MHSLRQQLYLVLNFDVGTFAVREENHAKRGHFCN